MLSPIIAEELARPTARPKSTFVTRNGDRIVVPTDPLVPEWRTEQEIRDGVPRFVRLEAAQ